jgi:hypothetical protein
VISLDCGMRAHMLPNILENCVAIAATAASRAFFLCASCSILDAERALWASLGARAARRRGGAARSLFPSGPPPPAPRRRRRLPRLPG